MRRHPSRFQGWSARCAAGRAAIRRTLRAAKTADACKHFTRACLRTMFAGAPRAYYAAAMAERQQDELRAVYAAMGEGELLQLAGERDDLTDDARAALAAEMQRRQLVPLPVERPAGYDEMEERPLVVV